MFRPPLDVQDDSSLPPNIDTLGYTSILEDLGIKGFLRNASMRPRLLLIIPILWLIISNILFLVSHPKYKGELQVIPATVGLSAAKANGLSGLLGSSGLGSLLSDNANDPLFSVYSESWTAPWFASDLAADQNLTRRIFHERWSSKTNDWKSLNKGVGYWARSLFGITDYRQAAPTPEEVLAYLREYVSVQHTRTNVISYVTFESDDPGLVRDLLQFGHQRITDHMRLIYQSRAKNSIDYIVNELQHVTVAEYRNALIEDLAQQEKIRMMAYANKEFLAQSFGIYVTNSPVWPRGVMVVIESLLVSVLIYIICVVVAAKPTTMAWLRAMLRLPPTPPMDPKEKFGR